MEKKQSTEGLPMFVESLMTREEWNERMRKYPKTSSNDWESAHWPKPNPFKWRFGMGRPLSEREIDNIYRNLDYIKRKAEFNEKKK